jgi:phosphoserine phosphatase
MKNSRKSITIPENLWTILENLWKIRRQLLIHKLTTRLATGELDTLPWLKKSIQFIKFKI